MICAICFLSLSFLKNNNLRIQTYLTQTLVKQILDGHEHAKAKMILVEAVDFS